MQQTIDTTVNSIHFLWAAYIVIFVANAGFALWVATNWSKLSRSQD